jgi:hypothetical protein
MEADRQINLAKEMMDKYNIMFDQAISIIDKCSMIKEECEKFDQVFGRIFYNSVIEYGIIKGNNQILFIKPGQDGSLQGYKNKYYNLAKYVNEKYGFTVICSNNPYKKPYNPIDDAYEVIKEYILEYIMLEFSLNFWAQQKEYISRKGPERQLHQLQQL